MKKQQLQINDICNFILDCFGAVNEYFGTYIKEFQRYDEIGCPRNDCLGSNLASCVYLELNKIGLIVILNMLNDQIVCNNCNLEFKNEARFRNVPPFLWIDTNKKQYFKLAVYQNKQKSVETFINFFSAILKVVKIILKQFSLFAIFFLIFILKINYESMIF